MISVLIPDPHSITALVPFSICIPVHASYSAPRLALNFDTITDVDKVAIATHEQAAHHMTSLAHAWPLLIRGPRTRYARMHITRGRVLCRAGL
ncbi:hypothetical protein EVAR_57130_1 [Eumeta japonica]|uniref:Uncharacterized protein n=1 Tax=Eumeta variegata TaxID=151549 RepID=A0A4C1YTS6_EUMVA|nr:hypothetical protein EVAR_57130_1 [Eumeta japonica]